MLVQIRLQKWKWIGHTFKKDSSAIEKQGFWNSQVHEEED